MFGKKMPFFRVLMPILILAFISLLLSCGTGGLTETTPSSTGGGGTGGNESKAAASIFLSSSSYTIKSGNTDSATITAIVQDASGAIISNSLVNFKSTGGGQLSASAVNTDANGQAKVAVYSGSDPTNRDIDITGTTATGLSSKVTVSITGSTLTMSPDTTNITDTGSITSSLLITVKDAEGKAVPNTTVTLSTNGTGSATLSSTEGTTNTSGQLSPVTVRGTSAGAVTVTAEALGASASQAYTVTAVVDTFGITDPAADPYSMSTADTLSVTVNAPGVTKVRFATTLGIINASSSIEDVDVASGTASANFTSSLAGSATIQVFGFNGTEPSAGSPTDTLEVQVSAPASAAAQITLQPSVSNVAPSGGGVENKAKLTATVRTSVASGGQMVGGAQVAFSIINPTGGGETIYPVTVPTDSTGQASTYFTSGSLPSSAEGVTVQAVVVGTAIKATTKLVIGGTPGSVFIGRGSMITITNDTTYQLPMVVSVADANGNAVQGAKVSLRLWPNQYSTGIWYDRDPDPKEEDFVPYITGTFNNEDVNENLIKDSGEDVNLNGQLDPSSSSAGTVPEQVVTDEYGMGSFYITYPKAAAVWIVAYLKASVEVQGTETTSYLTFTLPAEKGEAKQGILPPSNYQINLAVDAGGTVNYNFPRFNSTVATYTTSSSYSTIPVAGVTYSFTAPAGAASGTKYSDQVIIQDIYLGTFRIDVYVRVK